MTTVTSLLVTDNFNFTPASRPYTNAFTADGQLAIGATAAPHIRTNTLTAGTGITITNGPGTITVAAITPQSAYTLIQSVNTTSGTTATFTNAAIVNYNDLLFIFNNVQVSPDPGTYSLTASINGGSTYPITFYGTGQTNNYNTTPLGLTDTGAANTGTFGFLTLYNANVTTFRQFQGNIIGSDLTNVYISGVTESSVQLNAFQITLTGTTFSAGNISLYGR